MDTAMLLAAFGAGFAERLIVQRNPRFGVGPEGEEELSGSEAVSRVRRARPHTRASAEPGDE
jgi:hypothetical protein